jgi:rare lipoprotein A
MGSDASDTAMRRLLGSASLVVALIAAGCGSIPVEPPAAVHLPEAPPMVEAPPPVAEPASSPPAAPRLAKPRPKPRPVARAPRGGAYYMDDGPGDNPPANIASIPDAVPRLEPLHPIANRPYTVFGRDYVPRLDGTVQRERGMASWYGRKFHGRPTSSGERYDMYGMTAAHPTLPIPSYVRVTNVKNGRAVVVRVNDRGPFLNRRLIDLTYTAAWKLGFTETGSTEVEVEVLTTPGLASRPLQTAVRSDVASATDGRGRPVATMPVPMLAEAAAERLAFEAAPDEGAVRGDPSAAWLQFGSFASRDAAEAARHRLQHDLPWLAGTVELVVQGDAWRVQAGPWARRDDAVAAGDRVAAASGYRPVAVTR